MGLSAGVAWSLAGALAHSASDALRKTLSARGFGASDVVAGVAVLDAVVAPALALVLELAAPPPHLPHAAAGAGTAAAAGAAAAAASPPRYAPASYVLVALASAALMLASKLLYQTALGAAPLSLTVPYLAFTPAMVVAVAFFALGEAPPPAGLAGVAVVALGGFWLGLLGSAAGATEVGFAPPGAEGPGLRPSALGSAGGRQGGGRQGSVLAAPVGLAKKRSGGGGGAGSGGGGGGGGKAGPALPMSTPPLAGAASPPPPPSAAAAGSPEGAHLLATAIDGGEDGDGGGGGGGGAGPGRKNRPRRRSPSLLLKGGGGGAFPAGPHSSLLRSPTAMMLAVAAVWSVTATLDKAGVVRAPSVAAYFLAQRLAGGLGCALLLWRTARLAPLAGRVVAAGGGGGSGGGGGGGSSPALGKAVRSPSLAALEDGGSSGSGPDDDGAAAALDGAAAPAAAWARWLPWWAPPDLALMLAVCLVEQSAVAFFLFAVAHLLVSYCIALKRLQLLLSVAAGALMFGERIGRRLPAILLMVAGMVLIVLHPGAP